MPYSGTIGHNRIHFTQLDSTNAEAKRLIEKNKYVEGLVISADFQTRGRGQYGRNWQSEQGQNIIMSVILSPIFLEIQNQFSLNIAFSLAVAKTVSDYCDDVSIKWPNDIYVGNQKIAGILIQNFIQGNIIKSAIAGVGLNVFQKEWSLEIPNPTSLSLHTSEESLCKKKIIDQLCDEMNRNYLRLQLDIEKQKEEYKSLLFGLDKTNKFEFSKTSFEGIIKGIDAYGRLIVKQNDDSFAYSHDEIKMIIPK